MQLPIIVCYSSLKTAPAMRTYVRQRLHEVPTSKNMDGPPAIDVVHFFGRQEHLPGNATGLQIASRCKMEGTQISSKAKHAAAITEMKLLRGQMEALSKNYSSLIADKEMAQKKAQEAKSEAKEIEKIVQELTAELNATRESLESARSAHLDAEGQLIQISKAKKLESLNGDKEVKQAGEELDRVQQKLISTKDIATELETSSTLLFDLKVELSSQTVSKLALEKNGEGYSEAESEGTAGMGLQTAVVSVRNELEETKLHTEKAIAKVNYLKVAAVSLKSELEREKSSLSTIEKREQMVPVAAESIEGELNKIKLETELVRIKEKEAKEKIVDLEKQLQLVVQETDEAKSVVQLAQRAMRNAKEERDIASAADSTIATRLRAVLKEIEAAKASESFALATIDALVKIGTPRGTSDADLSDEVTLSLEEYYELSKQARKAEEQANIRVTAAICDVEVAKESEARSQQILQEVNLESVGGEAAKKVPLGMIIETDEGSAGIEQELIVQGEEREQIIREANASEARGVSIRLANSSSRSFGDRKESKKNFDQTSANNGSRSARFALSPNAYLQGSSTEMDSSPEGRVVKKKKSLFPRILKLIPRRKA